MHRPVLVRRAGNSPDQLAVDMHEGGTTDGIAAAVEVAKPEVEAMLLCARGTVTEAGRDRVKELVAGGIDWALVTNTALANQVLPLVASTLMAHHRADLPPRTVAYLEEYARGLAARNMMLTAELFRILDAFAASGIPAFPYKGPTLAATAYGGIQYRQFGDLDLLVPKDRYMDAKGVIEDIGFESLGPESSDHRYYLGRKSAHAFARGGIRVDLQWGSTTRKALSVPVDGSLWDINSEIDILGRSVRIIPPNILFLFLCAHGARHYWDRLKWVCDVAEMIRSHPQLDWHYVLETANKAGAARVLRMALFLADSLLDAPVPAWVMGSARTDPKAAQLASLAIENYFTGRSTRLESGMAQLRFTMATKERIRDRVRYLADLTLQPTEEDYEWLTLPNSTAFLYPVLRPIRLLVKRAKRGLPGAGTARTND